MRLFSASNNGKPWVMDPVSETMDDPPRDPGAGRAHHSFTDQDFEGHRAHSLFVGVSPATSASSGHHRPHHRSRRRHHRHHHRGGPDDDRPITPPSQRVQFILGEQDGDDSGLEPHPLFSEMGTLTEVDGGQLEWKETARWVKFEEDVEEGGNRWSKPHVGTLSLHSLFELRSLILNGTVMLDVEATAMENIADLILDNLINSAQITYDKRQQFRDALLRRHKHLHEKHRKGREDGGGGTGVGRLPLIRSLAEIGRAYSTSKMMKRNETFSGAGGGGDSSVDMHASPSGVSLSDANGHANGSCGDIAKRNLQFMRKIPPGAEASNILVGEVDYLEKPVSVFLRLSTASLLGDLTEVPVPTRFIFLLLGPQGGISRYHEIGRAMATLLSDEVFHDVAYKARNRGHLLAAVDEFLDAVTVLPPGEWDPSIRIEPPTSVPSQDQRKRPPNKDQEDDKPEVDDDEEERYRIESGLVRSGRLFGGLINDIKRKKPWYASDFKDALALQSVASFVFLYFACLTPIVTFGGLLSDATESRMAAMESLVSGLICGVVYGFCSGQPLNILGSTGPVLVFETILYEFCVSQTIDYLSFRLWVGLWIALFLVILVALDASAYVCYITRFTEENFATLIAFIFIIKAIEKVLHISHYQPLFDLGYNCSCVVSPRTNLTITRLANLSWSDVDTSKDCLRKWNGTLEGEKCHYLFNETHLHLEVDQANSHAFSDVFLMSLLLFILTFLMAVNLKDFKTASFFPTKIRAIISDFSVIIAIISMTVLDFFSGIDTPKLTVPREFKPTWHGRDWLIPFFNNNKWWTALVAVVPALLGVILIFMDQQITAVIVNRKEHKLKKGGGYHLDLFVLALLIVVNSLLGLPWFVAATVLAINHVNSLKLESETAAPGEKPQFLGVRENRVTHVLIFLTIGLSVLLVPVLRLIPMPVLFGVFLYMGVNALKGLQFFDRILIMFMPVKYQPDYTFLRQVPLRRIHLFTFIQLMCLVVLWVIKSIFYTSILFPIMLVVMVGVRKLLEYVFTKTELRILDDAMPEFTRKKKQEMKEAEEEEPSECGQIPINESGNLTIPLASGNVMRIPLDSVNISEEVNKSGVWLGINKENKQKAAPTDADDGLRERKRHRRHKGGSKRDKPLDANGLPLQLSTMPEEEEEDCGITIQVGRPPSPQQDREDKV